MLPIYTTAEHQYFRDFPKMRGIIDMIAEYQKRGANGINFTGPNSPTTTPPIVQKAALPMLQNAPYSFTIQSNDTGLPAPVTRLISIVWSN